MKTVTTFSGTFWLDAQGVLRKFECAEENYFKPDNDPDYRNEKHVYCLEIPEGVAALPAGAFDGYKIRSQIRLPETLTTLGDSAGGVFRHCRCPGKLELPGGITFVGEDSFFLSSFGVIRISDPVTAQTAQKLVHLFENHTSHYSLFYPAEKIRNLPPPQMPVIQLRNESGSFYMDRLGVLQSFVCSPENNADSCPAQTTKKLYTLDIPEGVTVLKADAFRGYTVLHKITLPSSLLLMGASYGCALADCQLPDVVIPETLQILGTFAFGHSSLRSLRLPENASWEYGRQFKSGKIKTLYLSRKYRAESGHRDLNRQIDGLLCQQMDGISYLNSFPVNDVRIGEIVWLEG